MRIGWRPEEWDQRHLNGTRSPKKIAFSKARSLCLGILSWMPRQDQWLSSVISGLFRSIQDWDWSSGVICLLTQINHDSKQGSFWHRWQIQEGTWSIWQLCCRRWTTEGKFIRDLLRLSLNVPGAKMISQHYIPACTTSRSSQWHNYQIKPRVPGELAIVTLVHLWTRGMIKGALEAQKHHNNGKLCP